MSPKPKRKEIHLLHPDHPHALASWWVPERMSPKLIDKIVKRAAVILKKYGLKYTSRELRRSLKGISH